MCLRSASPAGVAISNRYWLIRALRLGQAGSQLQSLPQVDVVMRSNIQSEVDADHHQAGGVSPSVAQPLEDGTPTIETPPGFEAQALQLFRGDSLGPKCDVAHPTGGIEPPFRRQQAALGTQPMIER